MYGATVQGDTLYVPADGSTAIPAPCSADIAQNHPGSLSLDVLCGIRMCNKSTHNKPWTHIMHRTGLLLRGMPRAENEADENHIYIRYGTRGLLLVR